MTHTAQAIESRPPLGAGDAPVVDAAVLVRQVAHDLRQPLSTIESIAYYLDIILPLREAKARGQLKRLQQMVLEANSVLNDAVHYCQAAPPRFELADLDEMITSCAAGVRDEPIEFELAEDLPPVPLDAGQIRHMLRNLCAYFRQMCSGGRLRIRTFASEGAAAMEISGEGAAFFADELRSLIEPVSAHLKSGSGLAMASVRRIVDAHGGSMHARTSGRAVALTIYFPAA